MSNGENTAASGTVNNSQRQVFLDWLRQLYPETFGRFGELETGESINAMADSLANRTRLKIRVGAEVVTVGEVVLDWREIWLALLEDREDVAQEIVNDGGGFTESEALSLAHCIMIGALEAVMRRAQSRMSNALDLLLEEAWFDSAAVLRKASGSYLLPDGPLVEWLTDRFRQSIRRQREGKTGRPKATVWARWNTIEQAMLAWPSKERPTLAAFELSLSPRELEGKTPLERQAEMARARGRLKAEIKKLHLEGFAHTPDWPKLWAHVRSESYKPVVFDPFSVTVDVDAGDSEH